ncbi:hypothetical protein [Succinivibrio dextrinosolvens]|uniref:hypothetical protein n=1 Tax=Succinivibrio dextrinosolvens TaxID=83771 RepID=UPI00241E6B82|nr:hypothetical protein [Succinivibrio dextrinosolvens]MBE6422796.1 hypothetical protein [Succinivibrio dextrinosolvens]
MQKENKQLSMLNECAKRICHADFNSAYKTLSDCINSNKRQFVLENFIRVIGQPFYVGIEIPKTDADRKMLHLCLLALNLAITHAPYGNSDKEIIVLQPLCDSLLDDRLFKRLSVLAEIFKLKFYSELKENRIRFERAALLCRTIYQYSPVSVNGMLAVSTYQKLVKEKLTDQDLIDFMLN